MSFSDILTTIFLIPLAIFSFYAIRYIYRSIQEQDEKERREKKANELYSPAWFEKFEKHMEWVNSPEGQAEIKCKRAEYDAEVACKNNGMGRRGGVRFHGEGVDYITRYPGGRRPIKRYR